MADPNNMKYDNYTRYGIHNETDRKLLSLYCSLVFISSLIGDTLILVGSLRYRAIRLHKQIVVFIQYIAVFDLAGAVFRVLPGSVSLLANRWIFGDFLCYTGYFVFCSSGAAVFLLITAMSCTKLIVVKFPLRAISFPARAAHITSLIMTLLSLCPPLLEILADRDGVYFNYLDYNCDYGYSSTDDSVQGWSSLASKICVIMVGIGGVFVTILTVTSNVMLIVVAKRVTRPGEVRWQGILVVVLSAAVVLLSALPGTIYFLGSYFVGKNQPDVFRVWHVQFYRFSTFWVLIITTFNFYIYTLTLSSFREFLRSGMRTIKHLLIGCFSREDFLTAEEHNED